MGKRRTLQKIGVLLKNLRETEICTSKKFKDQKLTTKKLLSRSWIEKNYLNKKRMSFLDKKNKFKNLIKQWVL